jgi:nitroimidazol reductase NimA-like FMN-containing flavoprotein (pyridoxamine 5'-phosphate oxidase superfamily)
LVEPSVRRILPGAARIEYAYDHVPMAITIPDELKDLVTTNALGHVSAIRGDGSVAQYLMWIDFDGEHLLTSSPVGSRKAGHWQRNPAVTISAVDRSNDWRFVIARGRVIAVHPDEGLAFIDKMSQRYTGGPYRWRNAEREVFTIEIDHLIARGAR